MRVERHDRPRQGGYIGDGYPICAHVPVRDFLRKGAAFRFLGTSPLPELQSDPTYFANTWAEPSGTKYSDDYRITRLTLDPARSSLYNKLCNASRDGGGRCTLASEVPVEMLPLEMARRVTTRGS